MSFPHMPLHQLVPRDGVDCEWVNVTCPVSGSFYGYTPQLASNVVFLVFFSLCLVAHGVQGIFYRDWWTFTAMVCGCICEIMGYGGRIAMHYNPYNLTGFLIQICCLTIAPAFFSAAIYVCLTRFVIVFGPEVCTVPANTYLWVFIFCDIVSLALQGAGGGLASVAAQNNTSLTEGDNVQLAGLAWQVACLTLFALCCAQYAWKVYSDPTVLTRAKLIMAQNPIFKFFMAALALSFTCIFIRCIYRIVELAPGWGSAQMSNETNFITCEGAMIVVAVVVLNLFFPGQYLTKRIAMELSSKHSDSSSTSSTPLEKPVEV